jgi:hypothetical protein
MPIWRDPPYLAWVIELRGARQLQKVQATEKCPRYSRLEDREVAEIKRHKNKLDGRNRAYLRRTSHVAVRGV